MPTPLGRRSTEGGRRQACRRQGGGRGRTRAVGADRGGGGGRPLCSRADGGQQSPYAGSGGRRRPVPGLARLRLRNKLAPYTPHRALQAAQAVRGPHDAAAPPPPPPPRVRVTSCTWLRLSQGGTRATLPGPPCSQGAITGPVPSRQTRPPEAGLNAARPCSPGAEGEAAAPGFLPVPCRLSS